MLGVRENIKDCQPTSLRGKIVQKNKITRLDYNHGANDLNQWVLINHMLWFALRPNRRCFFRPNCVV